MLTLIYEDTHRYKALTVKEFKNRKELNKFLKDSDDENFAPGECADYVVVEGEFTTEEESVDKT